VLSTSWLPNKARDNAAVEVLTALHISHLAKAIARYSAVQTGPNSQFGDEEGLGQAFVPSWYGGHRKRGSDESRAEARGDEPDQREHGACRGSRATVPRVVGHHLLLTIYGREGDYTFPSGRCSAEFERGRLKDFRVSSGRFGTV
jgi:hypothetical protein